MNAEQTTNAFSFFRMEIKMFGVISRVNQTFFLTYLFL